MKTTIIFLLFISSIAFSQETYKSLQKETCKINLKTTLKSDCLTFKDKTAITINLEKGYVYIELENGHIAPYNIIQKRVDVLGNKLFEVVSPENGYKFNVKVFTGEDHKIQMTPQSKEEDVIITEIIYWY